MNVVKIVLNEWERKNSKVWAIIKYRDIKKCDLKAAKRFCDELELNDYIKFSSNVYYFITIKGQKYIREQENKFIKNPWGIKPKIYEYCENKFLMYPNKTKSYKNIKNVLNTVFFIKDCNVFYDLEVKSIEDLKEKINLL